MLKSSLPPTPTAKTRTARRYWHKYYNTNLILLLCTIAVIDDTLAFQATFHTKTRQRCITASPILTTTSTTTLTPSKTPSSLSLSKKVQQKQKKKQNEISPPSFIDDEHPNGMSTYEWLQRRFNFSDEKMELTKKDRPQIFTLKQSVLEDRVNWIQKRFRLDGDDKSVKTLENIIQRNPTILSARSEESLKPKLQFFQQRLNLTDKKLMALLKKDPGIFNYSLERIEMIMDFYQTKKLALTDNELAKIILRCPRILALDPERNVLPKLEWLQQQYNITDEEIQKVVIGCPALLSISLTDNLQPKLLWFEQRVGISDKEAKKIFTTAPNMLLLNVDENIEPKLEYLQNELQLNTDQIKKAILKFPTLLNLSIEENLEPTKTWLQEKLQIDDDEIEMLGKVLYKQPNLFGYATDTMEQKFGSLRDMLKLDDAQTSKMIRSMPSLLSKTKTNLMQKVQFFVDHLGEEVTKDLLCKNPALSTYSLENRYIPRLAEAMREGLKIDKSCLRSMGLFPKRQWAAYIANQKKKMANEKLKDGWM